METLNERTVTTVPGATYSVAVLTPPVTLYAEKSNGERQKIRKLTEEKCYDFKALTYKTVFSGGYIGLLTRIGKVAGTILHVTQENDSTPAEPVQHTEAADVIRIPMSHATWFAVSPAASEVHLTPAADAGCAHSMQLLLTPPEELPQGWLSAEGADLIWPYGEASILGGFAYVVTLVQFPLGDCIKISANITPLGSL